MLLHKMFNFFEPGGKNPEGKSGGGDLARKWVVFLRGAGGGGGWYPNVHYGCQKFDWFLSKNSSYKSS